MGNNQKRWNSQEVNKLLAAIKENINISISQLQEQVFPQRTTYALSLKISKEKKLRGKMFPAWYPPPAPTWTEKEVKKLIQLTKKIPKVETTGIRCLEEDFRPIAKQLKKELYYVVQKAEALRRKGEIPRLITKVPLEKAEETIIKEIFTSVAFNSGYKQYLGRIKKVNNLRKEEGEKLLPKRTKAYIAKRLSEWKKKGQFVQILEDYYTPEEIAFMLGTTTAAIYAWIKNNLLTSDQKKNPNSSSNSRKELVIHWRNLRRFIWYHPQIIKRYQSTMDWYQFNELVFREDQLKKERMKKKNAKAAKKN